MFQMREKKKFRDEKEKETHEVSGAAEAWEQLGQECQTHFDRGHISRTIAFKGPNVILGLYKCNYSLTRGKELSTATG